MSNSGIGSADPTNVTIDPATGTVSGEVTGGGFCGANGTTTNNRAYYHLFFTAAVDQPVAGYGTWKDATVTPNSTTACGGEGFTTATRTNKGSGAYLNFAQGSTVNLRVGISYVSAANAKANLDAENPAGTSVRLRQDGRARRVEERALEDRRHARPDDDQRPADGLLHGALPRAAAADAGLATSTASTRAPTTSTATPAGRRRSTRPTRRPSTTRCRAGTSTAARCSC